MLTDSQWRTAKPYKLTDGNGLYLEIKPNGVKAWRYRFELREGKSIKESTFAIGDYVVAPKGTGVYVADQGDLLAEQRVTQARLAGASFSQNPHCGVVVHHAVHALSDLAQLLRRNVFFVAFEDIKYPVGDSLAVIGLVLHGVVLLNGPGRGLLSGSSHGLVGCGGFA